MKQHTINSTQLASNHTNYFVIQFVITPDSMLNNYGFNGSIDLAQTFKHSLDKLSYCKYKVLLPSIVT